MSSNPDYNRCKKQFTGLSGHKCVEVHAVVPANKCVDILRKYLIFLYKYDLSQKATNYYIMNTTRVWKKQSMFAMHSLSPSTSQATKYYGTDSDDH